MAKASDISLRKVNPIDSLKEKMHRLCTNARKGGTREGPTKELSLVDHTIILINFLTTTCCHDGMNYII